MNIYKDKKISEVPDPVRKPWSQSLGKKRVYGGNYYFVEKIGFKMGVKKRMSCSCR